MADAIPVNSNKKVNVKPADPSYIEKSMAASDNLGDARDFNGPSTVREMTSVLDIANGQQHVHTYTREDH